MINSIADHHRSSSSRWVSHRRDQVWSGESTSTLVALCLVLLADPEWFLWCYYMYCPAGGATVIRMLRCWWGLGLGWGVQSSSWQDQTQADRGRSCWLWWIPPCTPGRADSSSGTGSSWCLGVWGRWFVSGAPHKCEDNGFTAEVCCWNELINIMADQWAERKVPGLSGIKLCSSRYPATLRPSLRGREGKAAFDIPGGDYECLLMLFGSTNDFQAPVNDFLQEMQKKWCMCFTHWKHEVKVTDGHWT